MYEAKKLGSLGFIDMDYFNIILLTNNVGKFSLKLTSFKEFF